MAQNLGYLSQLCAGIEQSLAEGMPQHMWTERIQRLDDLAFLISTRRHLRSRHSTDLFDHGLDCARG
jgi:hypothetical protein